MKMDSTLDHFKENGYVYPIITVQDRILVSFTLVSKDITVQRMIEIIVIL